MLLGAAAGAGAKALGAGPLATPAQAASFVKGADVSRLPQTEAKGYYWNNGSGVRQDLFTVLKGYGITAVSLRTWVNPSSDPANGHCGIEETAQLAQRAKNAGGLEGRLAEIGLDPAGSAPFGEDDLSLSRTVARSASVMSVGYLGYQCPPLDTLLCYWEALPSCPGRAAIT